MKLALIIFSIIVLPLTMMSQIPLIEWQKCYGGSGYERPGSVIQLKDSNFVIVGFSDSNDGDVVGNHGTSDYWICKFDRFGSLIWQKCYGGSLHDAAFSIVETNNGELMICGETTSFDGNVNGNHSLPPNSDIWVIKLDLLGNLIWQKCFGGSGNETAFQIIETYDSAFVFAGLTKSNDGDVNGNHSIDTSDVWLVKFDSLGTILWQRCFGGNGEDFANTVIQTSDSGFATLGFSSSFNGEVTGNHDSTGVYSDIWLIKTDAIGNLEWQKCLGGSSYETGLSIIQNLDGNFIVLGNTTSNDGDVSGNHNIGSNDLWIVNLDVAGDINWQRCFGGSGDDYGRLLISQSMGRFVVLASTFSNDGDVIGNHSLFWDDYWIFGIDSSGNIDWQKCYGGSQEELVSSLMSTFDGGLIVCGYSCSNDGDVSGHHLPFYAGDYWVVKLSAPYVGVEETNNSVEGFSVYQNPVGNTIEMSFYFKDKENVNIQLIDITGRVLLQDAFSATNGLNKQQVLTQDLSDGIYFVRLQANGGAVTKKVVVQ